MSEVKEVKSNQLMLTATNYSIWKQVIRAQLDYENLFELVTRQESLKPEDKMKDKKALYIIMSSISGKELERTGVCTTAAELWKKCQENYEGSSEMLTEAVSAEWTGFGPRKGEDFITYCGRFETLLVKLQALKFEVPDINKHTTLRRKLPAAKKQYCVTWRMVNPNKEIEEMVAALKVFHHEEAALAREDTQEFGLFMQKASDKDKTRDKKPAEKKNVKPHEESSNNKMTFKREGRKPDYSNIICNNCNEKGHKWKQCSKLIEKMKTKVPFKSKDEVIFITAESGFISSTVNQDLWVADSGATTHVTPFKQLLTNFVEMKEPGKIVTGNQDGQVFGRGVFHYTSAHGPGTLTDVLYAPSFPVNIFSLDKVMKNGFDIMMSGQKKTISILSSEGKLVLQADGTGKALSYFTLHPRETGEPPNAISPFQCLLGTTIEEWHERFAHISPLKMKYLQKSDMVRNLKVEKEPSARCVDCLLGKSCRVSHPIREETPRQYDTSILHLDTVGPFHNIGYGNKRYYLMAVEEFSNYRFIKPAIDKAEIKHLVKKVIMEIKIETGNNVIGVHSDNGTEFVNEELRSWFAEQGIYHTTSATYTPEQNGMAERAIRAINDAARTMLIKSGLPMNLWPEAMKTAVYALNRVPSPKDPQKTRYELFYGVKPDVSNLKVFGQLAVVKNEPMGHKLEPRGKIVCFVGYTNKFNTFRVYDRQDNRIYETCNIRMLPLTYHVKEQTGEEDVILKRTITLRKDKVNNYSRPIEDNSEETEHQYEEIPAEAIINSFNINDQIHQEILEHASEQINQSDRAGNRDRMDVEAGEQEQIESFEEASNTPQRVSVVNPSRLTRSKIPGATAIFKQLSYKGKPAEYRGPGTGGVEDQAFLTLDGEPTTLKEAQMSEEWPKWQDAIKEEYKSLEKNKVFELVPRPERTKTIKNKLVFKIKRAADGSVDRYKARLVAKGFLQKANIDYQETFAPVASLTTIRIVLALAVQLSMKLFQIDVKTAFLYGGLKETLYMEIPEGYSAEPGHVCRLRKSLYGLKQAPRCWNSKFDETLTKFELKRSSYEDCLYFNENLSLILAIYVGDGLIACRDRELFEKLVDHLKKHFEITVKEASMFLNMCITEDGDDLIINQSHYAKKILELHGMNEANPTKTPMEVGEVNFEDSPKLDAKVPFKMVIGQLLYLALATRPDISLAVNVASRTNEPTEYHWDLVKRILRYINGTRELALRITKIPNWNFVGYSDADYANDVATRRSTSGYCIFLAKTPVYWRSARQSIVTLSTAEAEYVSSCELIKELIPIRLMLVEIGAIREEPTEVLIDNTSAINTSNDLQSRARTKHIDTRTRWISEKVHDGTVRVSHVPGELQLADIFTKPLPRVRFQWLRAFFLAMLVIFSLVTGRMSMPKYNFVQINPVYYC